MTGWSTKDADEELATRVIQFALRVPVIQHDDRAGTSEYDLKIIYPGGRAGAAEVVSTRDQARMSLATAAGKRGYTRCSELTRLWIVEVFPGTNIRENAKGIASVWDEERQSWVDRLVPGDVSAVAPFAFVAEGRFLGVLRHSSFSETTLATVFRDTLNRGEATRSVPATDWDVEPVGDEQEFYEWVRATERITSVEFVFKRPNPDAEREFEALFARMDELEASQIRESIKARDNERGLSKQALRTEQTSRMFIAAAMAAFGYVVGKGVSLGHRVRYDQRRNAARERIENVSPTWDAATEEVLGAVRRFVARRRQDE